MSISIQTQYHIIDSLSEGIMMTDTSGTILFANHAACELLDLPSDRIHQQKFAALFFNDPENDAFSQIVLDAVYSSRGRSEAVVPFHTKSGTKHLRVFVSFFSLTENEKGFIIAFMDLSKLQEMKDLSQDIERVSKMNRQLEMRNDLLQKTFGMYVSDTLVQELLDKKKRPELGGTKQTLSIMMSDLRGFTALSEQMDAEDLISMLNHYLAAMTEVIQQYHGTIIEFIGDGIMAVFGAPIPSRNHAEEAVAAAIGMQAAMSKVNQWNAKKGYPRLEMGIGLNTGDMIVGNVGSKKRMKYGVVGDQVNLCGRIESYTIGGQVLISPSMRDAISSPLTVERELTVQPKGVDHEIVLTHVTGIGEPYNVSIKTKSDTQKQLPAPLPVRFSFIKGKHVQEQFHYGGITALGRFTAVLETEADLKVYDNLQIQAGGNLLCKVLDTLDGASCLIQFTSIPSGFSAWVKRHSL